MYNKAVSFALIALKQKLHIEIFLCHLTQSESIIVGAVVKNDPLRLLYRPIKAHDSPDGREMLQ